MPRVKRGTTHVKRRKNILKATKGYMWGRKNLIRLAKTAIAKAGVQALQHRRKKKAQFRGLWMIRINAILRDKHNLSYSKFIPMLNKNKVILNRKMLAELAMNNPEIFNKVAEEVKA